MNKKVLIPLTIGSITAIALIAYQWKTAKGTLPEPKKASPEKQQSPFLKKSISRNEFISAIFSVVKPTQEMRTYLSKPWDSLSATELTAIRTYCESHSEPYLAALSLECIVTELLQKESKANLSKVAKEYIFSAPQFSDLNPVISSYFFQQGKVFIDQALKENPKDVSAKQALIMYQSEYEGDQPMVFLATLRETLALDSNNIETNWIHLNLLEKSQQWNKVLQKAKKLISLQPQNSNWYFVASNASARVGDSATARTFLNQAIKLKKNNQK